MSGDSWSLEYDACAQQGRELMARINLCSQLQRGTAPHCKLSAEICSALKQYSSDLTRLRESLIQLATSRRLTDRESARRLAMLDELITRERQMQTGFKEGSQGAQDPGRTALLGNSNPFSQDPWAQPGPSQYTDDDPLLSLDGIRQQQQQAIRNQDEGLEALSSVLQRQKQMAIDMGNEVDRQDDIIDDIHDHVDRTDQRLIRETKHVQLIDRKSATCWYWVVIILLLIAIVVIAVIPT